MIALVLSACSAPDRVGLTTDTAGRVSVRNCGTWIRAVRVVDPDTSRVVWSVTAPPGADGSDQHTVGEVRLGQAPKGWETTGVAPEPGRPLRLLVESSVEGITVLDVPALPPDAVYYDGRLRSGRFAEACHLFDPQEGWVRATGLVALLLSLSLLIGLAVGVVLLIRHNRPGRAGALPPPPAPPPPPPLPPVRT